MRPEVFQRLLDAADAANLPIAATCEAAVTMYCEHHGVPVPNVIRYLAERPRNAARQRQVERREANELDEWKAHFSW